MDEKTPLLRGTVDLEVKEKKRQKYFPEKSSTSLNEATPLLGGPVDLEEKEKVRQKYFQETSSTSSNESESASRGEFFVTMLPFIILQVVSQFNSSLQFLLQGHSCKIGNASFLG